MINEKRITWRNALTIRILNSFKPCARPRSRIYSRIWSQTFVILHRVSVPRRKGNDKLCSHSHYPYIVCQKCVHHVTSV